LGAQDHLAVLRYTDDAVTMPLQCGTQWDALAHIFYRGQMYNGHGLEHVTSTGATVNSIDRIADGVVGRGILLDIPRHRGVDWLEPGQSIDDVELAAARSALVAETDEAFMVDAAAVAANFEMMTRLADGTGAAMPAERLAGSARAIEVMRAENLVSRR